MMMAEAADIFCRSSVLLEAARPPTVVTQPQGGSWATHGRADFVGKKSTTYSRKAGKAETERGRGRENLAENIGVLLRAVRGVPGRVLGIIIVC